MIVYCKHGHNHDRQGLRPSMGDWQRSGSELKKSSSSGAGKVLKDGQLTDGQKLSTEAPSSVIFMD